MGKKKKKKETENKKQEMTSKIKPCTGTVWTARLFDTEIKEEWGVKIQET